MLTGGVLLLAGPGAAPAFARSPGVQLGVEVGAGWYRLLGVLGLLVGLLIVVLARREHRRRMAEEDDAGDAD